MGHIGYWNKHKKIIMSRTRLLEWIVSTTRVLHEMLRFSSCICIVIKKNFRVKVWWELKWLFQQQDMIYRNYQTPHCRWDKQFSYEPLKDLGSCIITIQRPTPPKQSLYFMQTGNEWNFRDGNRCMPHHFIRNEKSTVEMHCRSSF